MKCSARVSVIFYVVFLLLASAVSAFADSGSPPVDYIKETENGQYVFVMLAPSDEKCISKKPEIRKKYKKSGLYRNDGSVTPLWTVHWYSFGVYPSSDGKHVVRMGPWAASVDDLVVAFYNEGKQLERYLVCDLIDDENILNSTVSHFFRNSSVRYSDKDGTVLIRTVEDQSYLFSVKTGETLKKERNVLTN
ncbi:MAG: hypothetical protein ACYDHW_11405 [Syntrophorhabdaceae bacterium]